jgi:hypothetical protein
MKHDLDGQLCTNYPGLYRNRHDSLKQSMMRWGFACDDGWYPIIKTISELVSKHNSEVIALQVKEKFGSLRYYCSPADNYINGVVQIAGKISLITCEQCGMPGMCYSAGGRLAVRCPIHANYEQLRGAVHIPKIQRMKNVGLGWSMLITTLNDMVLNHNLRIKTPEASCKIRKEKNRLLITQTGDDDPFISGLIDFTNYYAMFVDEETGGIICKSLDLI